MTSEDLHERIIALCEECVLEHSVIEATVDEIVADVFTMREATELENYLLLQECDKKEARIDQLQDQVDKLMPGVPESLVQQLEHRRMERGSAEKCTALWLDLNEDVRRLEQELIEMIID